jgi:hypothetical protein
MTLSITRSQVILDEITDVKHELIILNKLIAIGYSVESLKRNEYIY